MVEGCCPHTERGRPGRKGAAAGAAQRGSGILPLFPPSSSTPRNRHRHTGNSFSRTKNAFGRSEIDFRSTEIDFSTLENSFWRSDNRFWRSKSLFGVPKSLSRAPKSISGTSKSVFDASDTFPAVRGSISDVSEPNPGPVGWWADGVIRIPDAIRTLKWMPEASQRVAGG
jgi:hypothetical protein